MISGQCVSIRSSRKNIWKSGTMVTSLGMSKPISTTTNSTFWPRNRMRAKAYPDIEATTMVPSVTTTAM
jgi:hypothetical protein